MQAVDTNNVQPLAHPLDSIQRLRPDNVSETDRRDHYQTLAPQVEAGLYLVPRVIE
jgi:aspartyl-tRNA(Asn)/glutamyl-tRNA(Gln) amidotransferase subunit C